MRIESIQLSTRDVLRCCSRHPQYTVRTATRSDCSDGFYAKMQHAALTPVHSGPFVLRAFCFFLLPLGPFETACHAGKKTRPDAVSKAAAPNPVRCVPLVAVVVVFVAVRHSISGLCRWRRSCRYILPVLLVAMNVRMLVASLSHHSQGTSRWRIRARGLGRSDLLKDGWFL